MSRSFFKNPSCASCGKNGEVWLCVTCGYAGCGRLEAGHMQKHQAAAGHPVAMNARTTVMWCLLCEEEVEGDAIRDRLIKKIQKKSIKSIPQENQGGLRGILNIGNTCFLAASMQCLAHTLPLHKTFRECPPYSAHELQNPTATQRLVMAVVDLFIAQWDQQTTPIDPSELLLCVQRLNALFHGYQQHDAQEFLRFVLTAVHEELRWPVAKEKGQSVISDIFQGVSKSTITCLHCGKDSHCVEPFYDLSLPIADAPSSGDSSPRSSCDSSPRESRKDTSWWGRAKFYLGFVPEPQVSLTDCLVQFTQSENLSGSNAYFCEHCKSKHPCRKQMAIQQWPEVLVVHLKRFRHSDYGGSVKVSRKIKISHQWTVHPGQTYNLTGFVQHMGSAGGGHYIAYNKIGSQWHCFDDSRVSEIDDVDSGEPYVLFFQKQVSKKNETLISNKPQWVAKRWLVGQSTMSTPPTSNFGLVCSHGLPSTSCPVFAKALFTFGSFPTTGGPKDLSPCAVCLEYIERYNYRLAQEHRLVTKFDTKSLPATTDLWYFIDANWVNSWRQYLRHGSISDSNKGCDPGNIDNSNLVKRIKTAKMTTDYVAVNKSVFDVFVYCHRFVGPLITGPTLDILEAKTGILVPDQEHGAWDLTQEQLGKIKYTS